MSDLREYKMDVNGYETTVQLTDKDAERLGLSSDDAVKTETVEASQLHDRHSVPADDDEELPFKSKSRSVKNKAR